MKLTNFRHLTLDPFAGFPATGQSQPSYSRRPRLIRGSVRGQARQFFLDHKLLFFQGLNANIVRSGTLALFINEDLKIGVLGFQAREVRLKIHGCLSFSS